jgi:hypothetical protein
MTEENQDICQSKQAVTAWNANLMPLKHKFEAFMFKPNASLVPGPLERLCRKSCVLVCLGKRLVMVIFPCKVPSCQTYRFSPSGCLCTTRFNIHKFYVLHTKCASILYGSRNKQRLFLSTAGPPNLSCSTSSVRKILSACEQHEYQHAERRMNNYGRTRL